MHSENDDEENSNTYSWEITPDKDEVQKILFSSLDSLLEPYEPALTEKESDEQWTTNEIIAALEKHYGLPQGDPELSIIEGPLLVENLKERGYIAVNTGMLQLQWLMKKKNH